jgi:hypothetical protein
MPRLRDATTGVIVNVSDATAARLPSQYRPIDAPAAGEGYAAMKVADLRAEIERRNEGREEADRLPSDGRKADLIAALEADDE